MQRLGEVSCGAPQEAVDFISWTYLGMVWCVCRSQGHPKSSYMKVVDEALRSTAWAGEVDRG